MKTIAFFNNKGGVGKTTLLYHLAWMYSDRGLSVLVADLDPQANLTSMFLPDETLLEIWKNDESSKLSIVHALSPIIRGIGDITTAPLQKINSRLHLIPGDLELARFEDELSEAWGKCLDGKEPAFRTTSAFYRIIQKTAVLVNTDIVLIDVGPNLGAMNRAALICADVLIVPLGPDLFSLQGLRNLGPTLSRWRNEWRIRLGENRTNELTLPSGKLLPLGYVLMQFGLRDSSMIQAYERWAKKIPGTYTKYLTGISEHTKIAESVADDPNCLATLKHYRSLIPMAMEARKPIFHLKAADGAIGAHGKAVRNCEDDFYKLSDLVLARLGVNWPAAS
ncbi:MAG: ParA family protein [Candidatus Methylacidiphilales bacterium]|nr:AAA family ATPase [Candidatus Methylacidiphilales bacterium]